MARIMLLGAFVFGGIPSLVTQAADLEGTLQKLKAYQPADGPQTLDRLTATLRSEMTSGDIETWKQLKRILHDPSITRRVKLEVFRVAVDKADARIATDMVSLALRWIDELAPAAELARRLQSNNGKRDEPTHTRIALLGEFIPLLRQDPWRGWIGGKQETVRLLQKVMVKMRGPGAGSEALLAFAASPAPIEYRRAAAEQVLATYLGGEPSVFLLRVLDASSFPKLRKLVRASSDPQEFHYGAAAALAYHGDREILPDLEALRPAFLAHHVNTEGFLIGHVWEINIQHPPSKLLEYISSTELLIAVQRRMWAIRRAVELGLPKPQIRQAILTHASQVKPQTKGKWTIRPGLSSLKKLGLELGVLRPDDLPNVKTPPKIRVTP